MCHPLAYRNRSEPIWAMPSDNPTAPWKEAVLYLAVRALASKRQRHNSKVRGRDQLRLPSVESRAAFHLPLIKDTQEDPLLREYVWVNRQKHLHQNLVWMEVHPAEADLSTYLPE